MKVFCWLGWKQPRSVERTEPSLGRVTEDGARPHVVAERRKRVERAVPRERSEGHDHPEVLERDDLALQEREAAVPLAGRRAVSRRGAVVHRGDVRAAQLEPVVASDRRRLVREPRAVHGRKEEVARAVAGEDPAGPVPRARRAPTRAPAPALERRRTRAPGDPVFLVGEPSDLVLATRSRHSTSRGQAWTDDDLSRIAWSASGQPSHARMLPTRGCPQARSAGSAARRPRRPRAAPSGPHRPDERLEPDWHPASGAGACSFEGTTGWPRRRHATHPGPPGRARTPSRPRPPAAPPRTQERLGEGSSGQAGAGDRPGQGDLAALERRHRRAERRVHLLEQAGRRRAEHVATRRTGHESATAKVGRSRRSRPPPTPAASAPSRHRRSSTCPPVCRRRAPPRPTASREGSASGSGQQDVALAPSRTRGPRAGPRLGRQEPGRDLGRERLRGRDRVRVERHDQHRSVEVRRHQVLDRRADASTSCPGSYAGSPGRFLISTRRPPCPRASVGLTQHRADAGRYEGPGPSVRPARRSSRARARRRPPCARRRGRGGRRRHRRMPRAGPSDHPGAEGDRGRTRVSPDGWRMHRGATIVGKSSGENGRIAIAPSLSTRVSDQAGGAEVVDRALHRGRRATQTARPWSISTYEAEPASLRDRAHQVLLDLVRVGLVGTPGGSPTASRGPTAIPSTLPYALPSTMFAVLRATPRRAISSSIVSGTSPP